jgi:TM2 domain-containing membrane protein YozV
MSVDVSRLSAGLPPAQQKAVREAYQQRAKNPTTAFLLCFFLGIFGAHRFYVGQIGQGVLRLVLSPLIIPGLILEIVDLFRVDQEVYDRNIKLAEGLVAEAMLATPNMAVERDALAQLEAVVREQEQAHAPEESTASPSFASEQATPVAEPEAAREPTYGWAAAPAVALAADEISQHAPEHEASERTDSGVAPAAVENNAAQSAAPLVAPELAYGARDWSDYAPPSSQPEPEQTLEPADEAPSWPGHAEPASASAYAGAVEAAPTDAWAADSTPTPDEERRWSEITPEMIAQAAVMADEQAPVGLVERPTYGRSGDPTDEFAYFDDPGPVAEVGEALGEPVTVSFASPPAANDASPDIFTPFVPPMYEPPSVPAYASWAPAAEVAPEQVDEHQVSVFAPETTAEPHPVAAEDSGTATLVLMPDEDAFSPVEMAQHPEAATVAEPAAEPPGFESHVTEEAHEPAEDPGRRVVKRVRVVRRLVVNGKVVHEATAEQVVDADADTAATAATLQHALGSSDAQTLATLANSGALPQRYAVDAVQGSLLPTPETTEGGSVGGDPTGGQL